MSSYSLNRSLERKLGSAGPQVIHILAELVRIGNLCLAQMPASYILGKEECLFHQAYAELYATSVLHAIVLNHDSQFSTAHSFVECCNRLLSTVCEVEEAQSVRADLLYLSFHEFAVSYLEFLEKYFTENCRAVVNSSGIESVQSRLITTIVLIKNLESAITFNDESSNRWEEHKSEANKPEQFGACCFRITMFKTTATRLQSIFGLLNSQLEELQRSYNQLKDSE